MTFSVVTTDGKQARKVVGTLWASDEAGARAIAPTLLGACDGGHFSIERAEEREIPLKVRETGCPRVFL